jgi:hypothetical protein
MLLISDKTGGWHQFALLCDHGKGKAVHGDSMSVLL